MSDTEPKEPPPGIEEQLRELLKRAHMSFVVAQPGSAGPAAPPRSEPPSGEEEGREKRLRPIREFSLRPRDVRDYLDRFVIRQDDAKKVLSVAICDHYNHVRRCLEDPSLREREHAKHNIILLGPTGVGKTYLVRCIARLIGVPFVKADATKFTETGYVGHDAEDLVRDLVKAADGDTDLAAYGIIFLDEIDKIAAAPNVVGKDVSGRGVQVNLLKLMEETDVSLFSQTDIIGQMQAVFDLQRGRAPGPRTINTRHILFIVSGAFTTLAEQVRKRVKSTRIGFSRDSAAETDEGELLRMALTKDFIDYGFESEFIGRLPVRVVCDALGADDLEAILRSSEDSILDQYRGDFAGYGIALEVADEAIRRIARLAHAEKTGARGLMTVLERVFREFKFEMPSTGVRMLRADEQTVEHPRESLARLLANKEHVLRESLARDVEAFAAEFERRHGLKLVFAPDAVAAIVDACMTGGKTVRALCAERFHDFEYGLKLISRNTGTNEFAISRDLVEHPESELSRRIAESFRREG